MFFPFRCGLLLVTMQLFASSLPQENNDKEKILVRKSNQRKQSADNSLRRRGTPYQSAMSMLNFYINRAGKNLSAEKKESSNKLKLS